MNKNQFKIEAYRFMEKIMGHNRLRNIYLKNCVRRYKQANCVFIHIPKTAGTSVANTIIGSRAGHFTSLEVSDFLGEEAYSSLFSFAISRDPARRLVSAYNYVKNRGGTDGGVRKESIYTSKYFRSFDSFVNEWLIQEDMKKVNALFKPQLPFVVDERNIQNVRYLGKVEDLAKVEIDLSLALNREIKFGVKNVAKKQYSSQIATSTLKVIHDLYKIDYEFFNY